MLASLFGCGDPGGASDEVHEARQKAASTQTEASSTFATVGRALDARTYSSGGTGRWKTCGMPPTPSGAQYDAQVTVVQTNVAPSMYSDVITEALRSSGWTIESDSGEWIEARKDGITFRAKYGGAGADLSIDSGCVDLSGDSVEGLTELPTDDLGIAPPT